MRLRGQVGQEDLTTAALFYALAAESSPDKGNSPFMTS